MNDKVSQAVTCWLDFFQAACKELVAGEGVELAAAADEAFRLAPEPRGDVVIDSPPEPPPEKEYQEFLLGRDDRGLIQRIRKRVVTDQTADIDSGIAALDAKIPAGHRVLLDV